MGCYDFRIHTHHDVFFAYRPVNARVESLLANGPCLLDKRRIPFLSFSSSVGDVLGLSA